MTNHDLLRRLQDAPFQPFRIRLSNGSAIDIRDAGSVIVGDSSAVVPLETVTDDRGYRIVRDWKTISISHIVEFIDLKERDSGPRRKRA
ncbi:MAG TPA: hypothetical protein VFC78_24515 [Tepidisphaeraceae bacterium]|nr:hypothetical protein [Tepidisphaeraceae bacterium]